MGLLSKIIAANVTTRIVKKLNEKGRAPAPRQEYIPANGPANAKVGVADRVTGFYRENPKLVAGMGVAVAALVLQQLTRKRSLY